MLAILKKFSIALLAGGLVIGVLVPGGVANAESGTASDTNTGAQESPAPAPEESADPAAPVTEDPADPAVPATETPADPTTEQPQSDVPSAEPVAPENQDVPSETNPDGFQTEPRTAEENEKIEAAAAGAIPQARAFSTSSLAAGFKPGYIISDTNFYKGDSMSAAQIQTFLNQRMAATGEGRCTIGNPGRTPGTPFGSTVVASRCLKDAAFSSPTRAANAYCSAYQGSNSAESSATIIARVARSCGINPRVLLVILQKEQSLVTDTWPTVRQFDYATGANCPDSGPGNSANCDAGSAGFANQVYFAAWHLKRYTAQNGMNYNPGRFNTILWNPNRGCGTSQVYIQNLATATLYTYTPYRPNDAALNAGWGEGDGCSSYGNRNFYQYYKQWFGSPNTFFADVPETQKFFKEIEWMGTSGLSGGFKTDDGRGVIYQPYASISREAMAAFLYRLEGANFTPPAVSPFVDVKPSDTFYRQITWMYAKGYSTGTRQPSGKPKFAPKDPVSRSAMAAFLYRYKGAKYTAPKVSPFADVKPSDKFYREITWMYAVKYSTGNRQPSGKPAYLPRDNVSRGAMAAFIYRMEH
ncbi:hypothetical protein G7068_07330 [Leucobacter viscericola]|uniref:SLH domain-containing protein n=1 Tax=Leucobacter viscericola TaxID=2714935 RepID=A0A6G7XF10_9MICO|nr:S-layer homology domain-containing protein [Leucobacter viscericola]QIK63029.1 hypothetical protein G7068_07330 [Leucobacter viscericola]